MLLGLRPVARSTVQLAETEVAVGDEGTHAEFARQHPGVTVADFSLRQILRLTPGGDFTEQAESPRLEATRLPLAREIEGAFYETRGVMNPARIQVCLAEPDAPQCIGSEPPRRRALLDTPLEERHGVG